MDEFSGVLKPLSDLMVSRDESRAGERYWGLVSTARCLGLLSTVRALWHLKQSKSGWSLL